MPTTSSTTYSGSFALSASATVQAMAHTSGLTDSPVASATYTISSAGYVAINSGGPAVGSFSADTDFTGGQTASTTSTISTAGVANAAPMAVYQTERWAMTAYTIPNLQPGAGYTVRMHFAEFYWTKTGQRIYNVFINGTQVLTNFDIVAASGGPLKAIVEQFPVAADSTGRITITYGVIADYPKSSGIEVIPGLSGQCVTPAISPSAGNYVGKAVVSIGDATPGATIYYTTNGSIPNTSSSVYTGPITLSASATVKAIAHLSGLTDSVVASSSYVISSSIAINSGGPTVGSFIADTDYTGGQPANTTATISTTGVTNPAPMAVYQSERYGMSAYTIPNLQPGASYTVRLHFAEFYWTTTGQRIFNVFINGTPVLSNFDIVAAAGGARKAVVEQFTAKADATGRISITYGVIKDLPKSSGIEVGP
jgi:hypothetical protein